eukprot:352884-Chlamydomonas_euryale.AAC.10
MTALHCSRSAMPASMVPATAAGMRTSHGCSRNAASLAMAARTVVMRRESRVCERRDGRGGGV